MGHLRSAEQVPQIIGCNCISNICIYLLKGLKPCYVAEVSTTR